MNPLMIISTAHGEFYYQVTYLLASVAMLLIFIGVGIKRKYPMHDWLLIGLSGILLMTIGMRVATFSIDEWGYFFSNRSALFPTGRTSLGALIGLFLGLGLAQKILKTRYPVLDVFAYILPIMVIIQRPGCLLAGCCFGVPGGAGFGIAYAGHYPVYYYHLSQGYTVTDAVASLPVHPFPLYIMIWAAVSLVLVYLFWKRLHSNGSLFLLSVALLTSGRWALEFLRDPVTNHQLGENVMGLKMVQWALMGLSFIAWTGLFLLERYGTIPKRTKRLVAIAPHLWWISILCLITITFSGILDDIDLILILGCFILYAVALVRHLMCTSKISVLNLSPLLLVITAGFFMGQTQKTSVTNDQNQEIKQHDPVLVFREYMHTVGYARGNVVADRGIYRGSGCDAQRIGTLEYHPKMSAGYHYEGIKTFDTGKRNIVGTGFTFSSFQTRRYNVDRTSSNPSGKIDFGVFAYFGRDWKDFGYRLGFMAGDMHYYSGEESPLHIEEISFMPLTQVRFGTLDGLYFKGSTADDYTYGYYRYIAKLSLGGAISINDLPYRWEVGVNQNTRLNFDLELPVGNNWRLRPSLAYTVDDPIVGLGIRYVVKKEQ